MASLWGRFLSLLEADGVASTAELEDLARAGLSAATACPSTKRAAVVVAAACSRPDVVAYLLAHSDALPGSIVAQGLSAAVVGASVEMTEAFCALGVAPDTPTPSGATALIEACRCCACAARHGRAAEVAALLRCVLVLLGAGADPNQTSASGGTPLATAARYGVTHLAMLLLKWGADPSQRSGGETPGEVAARHGHAELASTIAGWTASHPAG